MTRARRTTAGVLALACGLALAACTAGREPTSATSADPSAGTSVRTSGSSSPASPASPDPATAELRLPATPTTVLPGSGARLAVAASAALFAAAPVVVLAPADDPEAQAGAAGTAADLGAPLLLVPGAADPSARAWVGEVARLRAVAAVVVGPAALADRVHAAAPDLDVVVTDPAATPASPAPGRLFATPATADLPALTRPAPLTHAALVTDGDPGTLAAAATARAAGLGVAVVPGGDPTSPAGVRAIAAVAAPGDTLLVAGPAFTTATVPQDLDRRLRTAATGVELPGGGQVLFPGRRLVALYGTPGDPRLGVLGEQDAAASVARAKDLAATYQALTSEPVVPAFEIIATIADRDPGPDGNYSRERSVDELRPWVDAATQAGLYVVLDLQPGRTDFLTQARLYEELLARPGVGLALDPEWRLGPDQVHLRQIGGVDAGEVNAVAAWLADLTRVHHLPQKALVLHQFADRMIRDRASLDLSHPELAMVLHVDGQGNQPAKAGTWAALRRDAPAGLWWGWKNFIDEDTPMLTPEQTLQVSPVPDLITYQ